MTKSSPLAAASVARMRETGRPLDGRFVAAWIDCLRTVREGDGTGAGLRGRWPEPLRSGGIMRRSSRIKVMAFTYLLPGGLCAMGCGVERGGVESEG